MKSVLAMMLAAASAREAFYIAGDNTMFTDDNNSTAPTGDEAKAGGSST